MTDQLRPYPEYKDSGLPWLGRIPVHWGITRLKRLLAEPLRYGANEPAHLPHVGWPRYIRITDIAPEGGLRRSTLRSIPPDRAAAYLLSRGDLLFARTGATVGKTFLFRNADFPAAHAGYLIRARFIGDHVDPRFVWYFTQCSAYWDWLRTSQIQATIENVSAERYASLVLCLPPIDEQRSIADFLDAHGVLVRKFIRNRRRLIEVLSEQRQAIINQAVTRGLDPNVRLKPSGIDWLGDVPEHWRCVPIKRIALVNPSRSEAFHLRESADPVVFLPMEKVSVHGEVDISLRRPIREAWQGFTYFRRGDVLVAKITPCFENGKGACLANLPTEIGFGTTEFIVLRPQSGVISQYLYQLTCLTHFRTLGVESMTGAAGQQRVSHDFVANFRVPVPPVEEQDEIVRFIDQEARRFRMAIAAAQREIDLIREYRARLITDVVTGKVDGRHLVPPPGGVETDELLDLEAEDVLDEELPEGDDTDLPEEDSESD